ncbi:MAG TPA: hypothetical protein VL463_25965 [Kofleriaceae bacterium]|jgi:hypothetical protein|nr:hypothetical protein [Kofleriaceae bacterium]
MRSLALVVLVACAAPKPKPMAARLPPAKRLQVLLQAPQSLSHWIRGPVTINGVEASKADVARWNDAIVDPQCTPQLDKIYCVQRGDRTIRIYFDRDGGWHVSALVLSRE